MQVISPQGVVENPLEGPQWDMTEPEYRKAFGLNHSLLKHIEVNPLEFKYQSGLWEPPSPVMAFGQYADWLICNHDKEVELHSSFVRQPEDYSGNAAIWKAWKAGQLSERKTIITTDIHDRAMGLLAAIQKKAVWDIIKTARTQVPVFAVVHQGGFHVQIKGLLDMLPSDHVGIWDFKTATNCSVSYWRKHVCDLFYDSQAAWYRKICKLSGMEDKDRFVHIVMETNPPYHSQNYELSDGFFQHGNLLIEKWLDTYIRCEESGEWPGYPEGITLLTPPTYVEKELKSIW